MGEGPCNPPGLSGGRKCDVVILADPNTTAGRGQADDESQKIVGGNSGGDIRLRLRRFKGCMKLG